jgi:uncharacterized protein RhaS with RHS repeats
VHTELVRFGLRDYDATVGRWTTKDAAILRDGNTNLYGYAELDPVNNLDPFGYQTWKYETKPQDLVVGLRNALPDINEVVRDVLAAYADAVVVSTTGGTHNPDSAHPEGEAIDIRIWSDPNVQPPNFIDKNEVGWISAEDAKRLTEALQEALGDRFRVLNERTHPPGQEVWGGLHIHIEIRCP